jgi:hypothetical protein
LAGGAAGSSEEIMSKRGSESTIDRPEAEKPSADPFDGVDFKTPLLRLAKQYLGPFLAHKPDCADPALCTCGLREAVLEVQRRETLVIRYGSDA